MISTTIKESFFKMKMDDLDFLGGFYEYKDDTPFWRKRLENQTLPTEIVFLVGSTPHRFMCTEITLARALDVCESYREALTTTNVWELYCIPLHKGGDNSD